MLWLMGGNQAEQAMQVRHHLLPQPHVRIEDPVVELRALYRCRHQTQLGMQNNSCCQAASDGNFAQPRKITGRSHAARGWLQLQRPTCCSKASFSRRTSSSYITRSSACASP